jgi:hypothetical protein
MSCLSHILIKRQSCLLYLHNMEPCTASSLRKRELKAPNCLNLKRPFKSHAFNLTGKEVKKWEVTTDGRLMSSSCFCHTRGGKACKEENILAHC